MPAFFLCIFSEFPFWYNDVGMLVSIIIPVYNEEQSLPALLEEVISADTSPFYKEIIAVNDGSVDGTRRVLTRYEHRPEFIVLDHIRNRGKAEAIKTALHAARGDVILIQDADLEYSPRDYRKILAPFSGSSTQAVYGSRFLAAFWPENMPVLNWIANKVFVSTLCLLSGKHVTDEGTAYKAFRRELLDSMSITAHGFDFCADVTCQLLKRNIKIIEVPVSYRARSRREGKKPGFLDGMRVLWMMIRKRFF